MAAADRRELQTAGGVAFVLEGVVAPEGLAAVEALRHSLAAEDTTSLRFSILPADLPRTEEGFSKELLEEVPGEGHFVSRAVFRAFAKSLPWTPEYGVSGYLSESAFDQRIHKVYDSVETHIRYGHIHPEMALPPRDKACQCCLNGIERASTGKRRAQDVYIPPIAFIEALEGDQPLAGRLPLTAFSARSGRPANLGDNVLFSSPGFVLMKAYAEALEA